MPEMWITFGMFCTSEREGVRERDLFADGISCPTFLSLPCSNYLGNKAWTLNLTWDGKADFNAADEHEWEGSGLARTAKGLTFLQVYDAGLMVPADKPEESLNMIKNFVQGGSF